MHGCQANTGDAHGISQREVVKYLSSLDAQFAPVRHFLALQNGAYFFDDP
jgi:hypothetical protein